MDERTAFLAALKDAGLSQRRFCQETGIPPTTINSWLNNDHKLSRKHALSVVAYFPHLRAAFFPETIPTNRELKPSGTISTGGWVTEYAASARLEPVEAPPGYEPDEVQAYWLDAPLFPFAARTLFYADKVSSRPIGHIGHMCICVLPSGEKIAGVIQPGKADGLYDLFQGSDFKALSNAEVVAVHRVRWMSG